MFRNAMALLDTHSLWPWLRGAIKGDGLGSRVRAMLFVALCGVTAGMLLLALPRLLITQSATLKFDMEIGAGSTVGLFVNRFDRAPSRINVVPGIRRVYSFGGIVSDITIFRLDPSDLTGTTIKIYAALADDEGGVLRKFAPEEIAKWGRSDLTVIGSDSDSVTFVASGKNPYLLVGGTIQLRRSLPAWLSSLMADANTFRFFAPLVSAGFVLLLLVTLLEARQPMHLLLAAATTAAIVIFVQWLSGAGGLASLSRTVGRAAFLGTSARGNVMAILATLAVALVCALLAAVLFSRAAPRNVMAQRRVPGTYTAIGLVVVLLIVTPDLGGLIRAAVSQHFQPDWDGNNIVAWNWLVHEGYEPLRDFWYPYGGYYLFALPLPWGPLFQTLYTSFVYGALFVVLTRLTSRPLAACAFALFVYGGESAGLFPGAWRYLLAPLVVMSYAPDSSRGVGESRRRLFWLFCVFTCVFEPVQLIYAAPAVALILVLDIYQSRIWTRRLLVARLVRDFAVPGIFVVGYTAIVVFWWQGQGAFDFYRSLGDAAVYSAEPADLLGAVHAPPSIQFLILAAPFAFVAIGLAERLRQGRPDTLSNAMIVLGMVGFMMLQKHLVRSMDWQLFVVVCLSFAIYLVFAWQRAGLFGQAVIGAILGVAVAVLAQIGVLASLWSLAVSSPGRLAGSVMALAAPAQPFAVMNARRFAPDKFDFIDEKAVIASLAQTDGRVPRLFVLGDTPVLYILAGQVPPYHANDYNSSPIYEQKKVADFLERERPPVVVWDPNTQVFDLFQSMVRNPLTYNAAIAGYVPDRKVARFEILKRRTPGEPIALDFWRSKLGAIVTLGHFPRASSFSRLAPCPDTQSDCQEFLAVTKKDPAFAGSISVGVNVDGRLFDLKMQTVAGDRELYVSLDRLWFWGPMKASGLAPRIEASTTSAEVDVGIRRVARRNDILY